MAEKYQQIVNKLLFKDPINVLKFHTKIYGWNLVIEQISGPIFLLWKNGLLMKWTSKLFLNISGISISILYLRQQKFMHNLMLHLTCSPLGARNPIFLANLKKLARFCQILSFSLTLKVTSPPILTPTPLL